MRCHKPHPLIGGPMTEALVEPVLHVLLFVVLEVPQQIPLLGDGWWLPCCPPVGSRGNRYLAFLPIYIRVNCPEPRKSQNDFILAAIQNHELPQLSDSSIV